MRPQRKYDPHQQFYALTSFKYAGVDYKRGDKFDIGEMPSRSRVQFFQNWYIGYAEDFRDNMASIKEVAIDKKVENPTEEKKEEEETPKRQSSTRGRKRKTSQSNKD